MRRQWDRCPPLPIAVQRVGRALGIPDPKPVVVRSAAMNEESFNKLRSMFPLLPSSHITEPMSPEEFRRIHHG